MRSAGLFSLGAPPVDLAGMKTTDERIDAMREKLATLVEAVLRFSGELDADGEYIPGTLRKSVDQDELEERLVRLAANVAPLKGSVPQI